MMKKNIMVRYTLVPTSEDDNSSRVSKCLGSRKSKLLVFVLICAVVFGLVLVTYGHKELSYADIGEFDTPQGGKGLNQIFMNKTGKPRDFKKHHGISSLPYSSRKMKCQDMWKKRLPGVLIIGARKAGTRALIRFLNLHRGIAASKKETHFFDRNYDKGFEWYLDQMPYSCPYHLTVEKTPNYFVDGSVPELVHAFNASIKLLLILRNPIERAVSDYIQLKEKADDPSLVPPFEELAIEEDSGDINRSYAPIKRSLYSRHLDDWLEHFSLSQIFIVDGENLKNHPWEELYKVEEFLGLAHEITASRFVFNSTKQFYCVKMKRLDPLNVVLSKRSPSYQERCLSPSKGREHPPLSPHVKRKLQKFFDPFNKKLFEKINRTFDWS